MPKLTQKLIQTIKAFFSKALTQRAGLLAVLAVLVLSVGFVTRLGLLIYSAKTVSWNWSVPLVFVIGAFFDLAAALFWMAPLALFLACLPRVAVGKVGGRILGYGVLAIASYAMLFGMVGEYFFWEEFGVRYNFIAVDYLVYTQEVIGNIRESYPMPLILWSLGGASALVVLLISRTAWIATWAKAPLEAAGHRFKVAGVLVLVAVLLGVGVDQRSIPSFGNTYNQELAKDGLWSLFSAFRANQLDYEHFYPTMPIEAAFSRMQQRLPGQRAKSEAGGVEKDLLRFVKSDKPEQKLNVIQITVESLSADFLGHYGNTEGLTPYLDALIPKALVFDQLYATGTRTDRGMEALTLSVPPTPGRSLVKRPENGGLFTLGSVLRDRGYECSFIYGGYGYFDNMNTFFGENGYRVLDRTKVGAGDITFANAWGACDEDLLRWTLRQADVDTAAGKPFLHFVMTTSNHRPFTYPDGRIDLPSKTSGRSGGVKYTDYAIGRFLEEAAKHAWYKNTIFVIVADHCGSSAGRSALPVEKYHIPMIIYAPGGQVKPGAVSSICSQIDYAPTLLGMLGMSYESRFYGVDMLKLPKGWKGRALIGNYQKLGLYTEGHLTVLSPVRRHNDYVYDTKTHVLTPMEERTEQVDDAISFYETASWLFAHRKQVKTAAAANPVSLNYQKNQELNPVH